MDFENMTIDQLYELQDSLTQDINQLEKTRKAIAKSIKKKCSNVSGLR